MALMIMEYARDELIDKYILQTRLNLENKNIVRNPFMGSIKARGNLLILDMKPLYPNPLLLGVMITLPFLLISWLRFKVWWLIPLIFLIGTIPHTDYFIYMLFKKGARRKGYTGNIKLLNLKEGIRKLV